MKNLATLILLLVSQLAIAQEFVVDFSVPAEEMVYDFFQNDTVTISNVMVNNTDLSIGFFDKGDTDFPIGAGIVMSTGNALYIPFSFDFFSSANNDLNGDPDIDLAGMALSHDAASIEFDLVPTNDQLLDFKYVFASEEYPEFVGSVFNDAFLFLISGPGIDGEYSLNSFNAAMIPNEDLPVSINTVNEFSFPEYYNLNTGQMEFAFDGYTTEMPAEFMAEAGETYHVKIVVGDVGDSAYDSAIFLGYNSLGNSDSLVPPTDFELVAFSDEIIVDNASKYATGYHWDFGNGVTSDEKHPTEVAYDNTGTYTVSLTTTNYCCSNTFVAEVEIENVALAVQVEVLNNVTCFGYGDGAISLNVAGGVGENYTITSTPTISNYENMQAGSYVITVEDEAGTVVTSEFTITEPSLITHEASVSDSDQGLDNGTASVVIEGGIAPYEIVWSTGETTQEIQDLEPGIYTYTIEDSNGCIQAGSVEIGTIYAAMTSSVSILKDVSCYAGNDGAAVIDVQGGNAPYQIVYDPEILDLNAISAGVYIVTITDQDGQAIEDEFTITEPEELVLTEDVEATTEGQSTGSITIDISGGTEPYAILWSTGETTETIENLAEGPYTVEITDGNNCALTSSFDVGSVVSIYDSEFADFVITPNPAINEVQLSHFKGRITNLYAIDISGHKLAVPYTADQSQAIVNTSNLASGVYILRVVNSEGVVQSSKLVKQ